MIAELADVPARAKFAARIKAAGLTPAHLVADYSALTEQVYPEPLNAFRGIPIITAAEWVHAGVNVGSGSATAKKSAS